ncbi:hypothetical protein [Paenibacillus sp. QZ-Y1]|uniref:hypothetical protein n=1 Tax=Paenibacillus sp. QZ-Y1 TaxID=3414511 RepID=UPI003F796209
MQFEQAKEKYYSNLSAYRKQQFDEAIARFKADRNSPIGIGEDWAYLTVLTMSGD